MILDEILAHKAVEIADRRGRLSEQQVASRAAAAPPPLDFTGALRKPGLSVIAEIKRSSPARGALRLNLDAPEMARLYEKAGASAISVLTDERYFRGSDEDLIAVRAAVNVPLLRKEFVLDAYQVYEARALGADAILLIVRALEPGHLRSLAALAGRLGMAALVEVHTEMELRAAIDAGATLIGINNRDLTRMVVDIETTARLRPLIPADVTLVSESGIKTVQDASRLESLGIDAILVGEGLVTAPDPAARLAELAAVGSTRVTQGRS